MFSFAESLRTSSLYESNDDVRILQILIDMQNSSDQNIDYRCFINTLYDFSTVGRSWWNLRDITPVTDQK